MDIEYIIQFLNSMDEPLMALEVSAMNNRLEAFANGMDKDISRIMIESMKTLLAAKQAKIDALMIEYCPGEMTPAQMNEWQKHQVKASDSQANGIV